jgi:hypothetical protein
MDRVPPPLGDQVLGRVHGQAARQFRGAHFRPALKRHAVPDANAVVLAPEGDARAVLAHRHRADLVRPGPAADGDPRQVARQDRQRLLVLLAEEDLALDLPQLDLTTQRDGQPAPIGRERQRADRGLDRVVAHPAAQDAVRRP